MKKRLVSLIVPVYNEEEKLAFFLENIQNETIGFNCEIIIFNDGSTDNSLKIINSFALKNKHIRVLSYNQNKGRGFGLSKSFDAAKGEFIIYFDADILITKETILGIEKELYENDLVIGSKKTSSFRRMAFFRQVLSNSYDFLAKNLIDKRINEFQCGVKGIRKTSYEKISCFMIEKGWSWDTELIMYAGLNNLKIKEVQVNLKFLNRTSRVNIFMDSSKMGLNLVKLWLKKKSYISVINFFDNTSKTYKENRYSRIKKIFENESEDFITAIDPIKNEKILDLGCGDGYYSSILRDYNAIVLGIDSSASMIKKLKENGIKGKVAHIENFYLKMKFNKIVFSGSLEFCHNPFGSLKNAKLHLKKKGKVIILFPRNSFVGFLYTLYYFFRGIKITTFTKEDISDMLRDCGFKNIKIKKSTMLTSIATCEN